MATSYTRAGEIGARQVSPGGSRGGTMQLFLKIVVGALGLVLGVAIGLRWLHAVAVIVVCIALGRAIGPDVDGFDTGMLFFTIMDLVMAGVLVAAARPAAQLAAE
jgi:hypothetical protein